MATVRIYKVAELLGTTSQEVTALLKRDHGIEVKSASSTIEEVVGRQFVERLAKQRGITLPTGDIFAETAAHHAPVKGGAKKPAAAKKAPEPARPAAPALPPPRLVKTAKPVPAAPVADALEAEEPAVEDARAHPPSPEPEPEPTVEVDAPGERQPMAAQALAPEPVVDGRHQARAPEEPIHAEAMPGDVAARPIEP